MKLILTITLAGLWNIGTFCEILKNLSLTLDVFPWFVKHDHITVFLANPLWIVLFLIQGIPSLMLLDRWIIVWNIWASFAWFGTWLLSGVGSGLVSK